MENNRHAISPFLHVIAAPPITEFKHPDAKRKNLPPAGNPPGERAAEQPKAKIAYSPRLANSDLILSLADRFHDLHDEAEPGGNTRHNRTEQQPNRALTTEAKRVRLIFKLWPLFDELPVFRT